VLKDTKESTLVGRRIRELGIKVMTDSAILRCEPGGLELAGPYGATRELTADAVVAVTQRLADDNLYTQLKAIPEALAAEEIEAVFRVGDCNAPRLITEAVFDGHRLAREIDARDPAVPLPHRRELPTVTRR
jgi:dimethylamine/trimethylamine dehydrogenase